VEKQYNYSFITTWKIKASLQDVWELIYNHENWPQWWKGVLKAETLNEGDEKNIGKVVGYT